VRRLRRRREDGAIATEAALITPLIVLLIFGIVELSLLLLDYQAVNAATRAGARTASSLPKIDGFAQAAANQVANEAGPITTSSVQELWVYKAKSNSRLPVGQASFSNCTRCVKFRWNGTAFVPTFTGWTAAQINACPKNPALTDRVGVYMRTLHDTASQLIVRNSTIESVTVLNMEPIPGSCTGVFDPDEPTP
jgi:Flp pilus assembly protein TadG